MNDLDAGRTPFLFTFKCKLMFSSLKRFCFLLGMCLCLLCAVQSSMAENRMGRESFDDGCLFAKGDHSDPEQFNFDYKGWRALRLPLTGFGLGLEKVAKPRAQNASVVYAVQRRLSRP